MRIRAEILLDRGAMHFDGDPAALTEMDALIAYLQMLGTLVDFSKYDETSGYR